MEEEEPSWLKVYFKDELARMYGNGIGFEYKTGIYPRKYSEDIEDYAWNLKERHGKHSFVIPAVCEERLVRLIVAKILPNSIFNQENAAPSSTSSSLSSRLTVVFVKAYLPPTMKGKNPSLYADKNTDYLIEDEFKVFRERKTKEIKDEIFDSSSSYFGPVVVGFPYYLSLESYVTGHLCTTFKYSTGDAYEPKWTHDKTLVHDYFVPQDWILTNSNLLDSCFVLIQSSHYGYYYYATQNVEFVF